MFEYVGQPVSTADVPFVTGVASLCNIIANFSPGLLPDARFLSNGW